jgi:phosphate transport system substrate-binding protein
VTTASRKRLGALALAATFAVGACTPGAENGNGGVRGTIVVSGSSTVEPISTGVAEMFRERNRGFNYAVEGPGTGDGFQRFCNGETDISDASRRIKPEEAAICEAAGIEYIGLKVAIDGLTVLTSPSNPVACLTFTDLYGLLGPESQGLRTWGAAQAFAAQLGSTTTFPDGDLVITAPGEESGTFDSFVELVIGKMAEARGLDEQQRTTRPDYTASANDNAIVEGISGAPTSLGWVGYAFYEENAAQVHAIAIDREGDGACVEPTDETIADGSYPIARDLYIYVNTAKAEENEALAAYVDFYLAEGTIAEVLEWVPFVNLPPDELAETRAAWEGR